MRGALGRLQQQSLVRVCALVVALVTQAPNVARAAPLELGGQDWEGLSGFAEIARDELGPERIYASAVLDLDALKPEDGVILVHPERPLDVESLAAFMRQGGRVVLLDDFGTGEALLSHFSVQRVPVPTHPVEFLRNNPEFAIAEPEESHPVVRDVKKLVTNHATGVRHADLSPILKIRGDGEPDVLVAQAGAVGKGRLLVMGDASAVMNAMLRFPGNRAFAHGIVRYAVEDEPQMKRSGRLVLASGAFAQKGSFGERSGVAKQAHERLRDAREALASAQKNGLPAVILYALTLVVGIGLVAWVAARAGRTHAPSPPRFTRALPMLAQGGVAGRAALLGAPKTSRALALLEIKNAIEETLAVELGLDHVPAQAELLKKVEEARVLDAEGVSALKPLLVRLTYIETILLSRRPDALPRLRDRDVLEAAVTVRSILEKLHGQQGNA